MRHRRLAVFVLQLLVTSLCVQAAAGFEPGRVTVTPSTVELGTFYGGAKVHVAGNTLAGSKVVVVVRGPSTAEVFNNLGRVGPIWVNTGKVTISGVPSLLLIFSSEPIKACLNSAAIDHYQLDLESLRRHIQIEMKGPGRNGIADDFLAFKAHQGTYRISSGGVQMGVTAEEGVSYSLDFDMPKTAGPGKYEIDVLECSGGAVVNNADLDLAMEEVGFPAVIARMARERAPLYGAMSVIMAMVVGFGIDFVAARIFRRTL